MEAEPAITLHDLPEPLLEHILVLAGSKDGRGAARVCRRWRDLVHGQPALWRSVRLSATWSCSGEESAPPSQLEVQLGVLQRVAPHVRSFHCESFSYAEHGWPDHDRPTPLQLRHFLAALHPGAAQEVHLRFQQEDAQLAAADVAALQRLQGLARLELVCRSDARLEAGALRALAGLTQLTELSLDCGGAVDGHTRDHLVRSVLQLSRLQRLRLRSGAAGLPPEVVRLTVLARLRHLSLADESEASTTRFPRPADFPALESYALEAAGGPRPFFSGCSTCLEDCSFGMLPSTLVLCGLRRLAAMQTLADALLPRRGGPLRELAIFLGLFEPDTQWECRELAQLRALKLLVGGGACDEALAGILFQAPLLARLELQHLAVDALPGGAYLSSLRAVSLQHLGLQLAPLAAATALEQLDVEDKSLLPADVDMLLSLLQSLASLKPDRMSIAAPGTPPELLDRLRAAGAVVK